MRASSTRRYKETKRQGARKDFSVICQENDIELARL